MAWYDFIAVFRQRFPVTFDSVKEERAVFRVAQRADKELKSKQGESKLVYSLLLWTWTVSFNRGGRIPAEELAILSPFIDSIIDGNGPALMLPEYDQDEYVDPGPKILRQFKKRMQAEGLWPQPQN